MIEDEPGIRALIRLILEMEGIQVEEAEDAQTAAQKIRSVARLDFVISDYTIPGGDLEGLTALANSYHPSVKLVVTSGHPEAELSLHTGDAGKSVFLAKPFSVEQLTTIVRMLDSDGGSQA